MSLNSFFCLLFVFLCVFLSLCYNCFYFCVFWHVHLLCVLNAWREVCLMFIHDIIVITITFSRLFYLSHTLLSFCQSSSNEYDDDDDDDDDEDDDYDDNAIFLISDVQVKKSCLIVH